MGNQDRKDSTTEKVSDVEFQNIYNEVAKRGRKKNDLREKLGLKDSRPIGVRRARLEKKGYKFERFGARPPGPSAEQNLDGDGPAGLAPPEAPSLDVPEAQGPHQDPRDAAQGLPEEHRQRRSRPPADHRAHDPAPRAAELAHEPSATNRAPGVPTIFMSDWHWGEVVDPRQVGGVNEFNLEIAQRRAKRLVEQTIYLLKEHMVNPDYPGIVCALGGDMFSGDIHEELMATNEREIMPTFLDVHGVLIWCIERLAKEFGRVFVPCVTGNHGRNTHKTRAKGRNFTSFDLAPVPTPREALRA